MEIGGLRSRTTAQQCGSRLHHYSYPQ